MIEDFKTDKLKAGIKQKNDTEKTVDYDELLTAAGEFGWYQVFLFVSTFPFYIFGVFSYFTQIFLTEVSPNHWCWIPELENLTAIERRNLAIPSDQNARFGYSQCTAYVANWSEVLASGGSTNPSWSIQACQNGWEFNKTEIPYPTIASEMGWVCERDNYQATAQSIFFVGSIIGGFLIGWIGDRFGRLPGAVCSNMIGCIAGILSTFSQNFLHFALCRFFVGISFDNCMMMTYLLVLEYVAPKYRSLAANMPFAIAFTSGLVALPWIALACGHWKVISLVCSIPMALSLLTPLILPESPRWLLSKGRIDEAMTKVLKIGRVNKKTVPLELVAQFKQTAENEQKAQDSLLTLLKRPLLMRMFACLCLCYLCCTIIFDVLIRSLGGFNFNFFMSFTVVSATEFPSLVLLSFILDWSGRKFLMVITLLICCVFSIMAAFVPNGLPSVLCAVITRFVVNMSCNATMQWAVEALPTPVRGTGASIVHIFGFIGTVISPFVVYLNKITYWLPLVLAGGLAALAAVISLGVPETANRNLPQTFEDAEELIKSQGILEWPCCKKEVVHTSIGHVNNSFELN